MQPGEWERVAATIKLTDSEKAFLERMAKRKKLWLVFSVVSVAVAIAFFVYHALIVKDFNMLRFVVLLLLLLTGRSHLRQYRSAVIFSKLRGSVT
jgi:hypothetical protein